MSEYTFYESKPYSSAAVSAGGMDAVYTTARTTYGGTTTNTYVGQYKSVDYVCLEAFLQFDTHILEFCTISAVTLSVCFERDSSDTDFTIEVRPKTWGTSVDGSDWVSGASLGGLTLLASRSTSGISAGTTYYDFSSEAAFVSNINKTGWTQLLLNSSRHRTGNAPTGDEFVDIRHAGVDTYQAKLVVTYTGEIIREGTGAIQPSAVALGGAGGIKAIGTGALTTAAVALHGADIYGTGAIQPSAVAMGGTGHMDATGTGALTIASPALSGAMWMDSAHLRHLGGKAMLWGTKGRAEIRGLKGKASM